MSEEYMRKWYQRRKEDPAWVEKRRKAANRYYRRLKSDPRALARHQKYAEKYQEVNRKYLLLYNKSRKRALVLHPGKRNVDQEARALYVRRIMAQSGLKRVGVKELKKAA